MEDLSKYMTVRQAAEKLDISEESVRELIKDKQLRAVKVGKWRIKPQDLEGFIESKSNMA